MRSIFLLLFMSMALAATDITVNNFLGNVTAPFSTATGNAGLLGILVGAGLAFLAWRMQVSLPAIFVGATLILGLMAQYNYISPEWVYAALILGGIISGVGIARWLGLVR